MNYGYEPTSFDIELADRLKPIVDKFGEGMDSWNRPYVEINNFYPGVRIRKITYLTDDKQDALISECDAVHKELLEKHSVPA